MLACVIVPSEKTDTKRCLACECWCAIVPADTTGTLACNEFRMLMRHRAVRKDRHGGEQRVTNARVRHRAVRKDKHAGMCPGRCGQKRCVQSAVARCASLHVSYSTRWQRRGQKSHMRDHCHLCHAGTSGICEASAGSACRRAASARAACRCRISVWNQSGWKWQHSSESIKCSRRRNSSCVRFTCGHSLWSCEIFKMVTASATATCLRRASHMAGLSARSCRSLLASSGGRQVLSRHFSRVRAYHRHTSAPQDPVRHFFGSMVAGNCLFDMASRRCGQKRHTAPTGATGRQQDMRRPAVIITCTLQATFLLMHSLLWTIPDICLLQIHASLDDVIRTMLRHKWSDESLFPIYKLGDEKHCKMASVRDVRHEFAPGNVGEPKTVRIKQTSFERQPVLWETTRLKWRWTCSWLKTKHLQYLHIIHRMKIISS